MLFCINNIFILVISFSLSAYIETAKSHIFTLPLLLSRKCVGSLESGEIRLLLIKLGEGVPYMDKILESGR